MNIFKRRKIISIGRGLSRIYGRGRRIGTVPGTKAASLALIALMLFPQTVYALPQGASAVGGNSTITKPDSSTMHINQTTDKSIINWQGYSIAANEKVQYFQPSSSSISLNRVIGADPSHIYGQLNANGQVWVINPNGILVGNGAKINVGGLLLSTLNIGNEDFMAGNYKFRQEAIGNGLSAITNLGDITTNTGGYVVMIAPSISNEGIITSNLGKTYMASADEVTLNFAGNDLIGFTIDKGVIESAAGITNKGVIIADGGQVILSAKAASDVIKSVINNEGIIQARTIEKKNGVIKLLSGMENNSVKVSGTLDASALVEGDGGFIETSAAKVKIEDNAKITTYAPYGKTGTWLIDPQDYTIAVSGGDLTGSQLSTNLGSSNVTILSNNGATPGNGDIFVNDSVSWSANTLTLTAARHININAVMTASGTSALIMNASTANGSDSSVSGGTIKVGFNSDGTFKGRVDFPGRSGTGFLTINGSGYTVINSLGAAGSTTGTDLQGMGGNLSRRYALGSDIDASATSGWNAGAGFLPVGNSSTEFTGVFDGLGHTISSLTINRPAFGRIGLFGYTTNTSTIRNVGLVGGSVSGKEYTGGLVGINAGTITNAYNTGNVIGTENTDLDDYGGLVGYNTGTISDSYASGSVSGDLNVGGLVGRNTGTIADSYSTGTAAGSDSYGDEVGGLAGDNSGTITNSYATGSVTGSNYVGGLVGYDSNGTITNSYATGSVTGSNYVGGLVGYNWNGTITNSYWNKTVNSAPALDNGLGTGLTTTQMKRQANFSGWDFVNKWNIDSGSYVSYPYLRANEQSPHPGRSGGNSDSSSSSTDSSNTAVVQATQEVTAIETTTVQTQASSDSAPISVRMASAPEPDKFFTVQTTYDNAIFTEDHSGDGDNKKKNITQCKQ